MRRDLIHRRSAVPLPRCDGEGFWRVVPDVAFPAAAGKVAERSEVG